MVVPFSVYALLASVGVLALAASVVVYRRTHRLDFELRAICALAAVFACVVGLVHIALVLSGPAHDWAAIRLAPSVALRYGYDLYYPETSGPLLSTIYGPMSVLLYLPAAFIDDITRSLQFAGALRTASVLLPLAYLFHRASEGRRGLAFAFFLLTAGAMTSDVAMLQVFGTIHVDAPAIGLGILSCALLLGGARVAPGARQLAGAAVCVVLSAWTKQVDAPLVFAQLAWLGIAHGRKVAFAYFKWCAVAGAAITLAIVGVFGFEDTFFNVITVPGEHGRYPLGPILSEAARLALPFLGVIGWVLFRRSERTRIPLAENWALLLLCALALFPTSFLARAKLGGFQNSWHSQFYLIAGAGLAVFALVTAARATKADRLIAIALCLLPLPYEPWTRTLNIYSRQNSENRMERALAFCEAHKHEAFFPWNPLVTLLSDGRLYHFEWAVRDRAIAGYVPTDKHIRDHLPERLTYVVYPADRFKQPETIGRELLERLPEFSKRVEVPGLEEYAVFVRE